jgi:hypothetical protein
MKQILKSATAKLDYTWDWGTLGTWLGADTIASHTVTCTGCTLVSSADTDTTVTAWISGGTEGGTPPTAKCHIVTAAGREDDRTIVFVITDR